jgi:hypothetical protein
MNKSVKNILCIIGIISSLNAGACENYRIKAQVKCNYPTNCYLIFNNGGISKYTKQFSTNLFSKMSSFNNLWVRGNMNIKEDEVIKINSVKAYFRDGFEEASMAKRNDQCF